MQKKVALSGFPSPGPRPCCTQFNALSEANTVYLLYDCFFFNIIITLLLSYFFHFYNLLLFFLSVLYIFCSLSLSFFTVITTIIRVSRRSTISLTQEDLMVDHVPCPQPSLRFPQHGET